MRGNGARVFLDLFFQEVDGGLELSVLSGEGGVGKIVDDDVGIDAVAFDEPDAVRAVDAGFRGGGYAVVGLHIAAGEPDFSAPCAGADDCAHLQALEAFAEGFTVGGGFLIAKDDDVPAEGVLHVPTWIADARLPVEPGLAQQVTQQP